MISRSGRDESEIGDGERPRGEELKDCSSRAEGGEVRVECSSEYPPALSSGFRVRAKARENKPRSRTRPARSLPRPGKGKEGKDRDTLQTDGNVPS